eukprot:CAMPEP_0198280988 /NCGR_PEP_ID=MMETSP1449-20131203/1018_1 /TAXON_ID=420275 /ORGANISM="Attheya septentrionalis, Strain CCMP2084" /LENGTH=37 /DNA_ID= /DNA_START= /DNA_END= /DNA_ORIENTATION=
MSRSDYRKELFRRFDEVDAEEARKQHMQQRGDTIENA